MRNQASLYECNKLYRRLEKRRLLEQGRTAQVPPALPPATRRITGTLSLGKNEKGTDAAIGNTSPTQIPTVHTRRRKGGGRRK